jgi:hypothetical protein
LKLIDFFKSTVFAKKTEKTTPNKIVTEILMRILLNKNIEANENFGQSVVIIYGINLNNKLISTSVIKYNKLRILFHLIILIIRGIIINFK